MISDSLCVSVESLASFKDLVRVILSLGLEYIAKMFPNQLQIYLARQKICRCNFSGNDH